MCTLPSKTIYARGERRLWRRYVCLVTCRGLMSQYQSWLVSKCPAKKTHRWSLELVNRGTNGVERRASGKVKSISTQVLKKVSQALKVNREKLTLAPEGYTCPRNYRRTRRTIIFDKIRVTCDLPHPHVPVFIVAGLEMFRLENTEIDTRGYNNNNNKRPVVLHMAAPEDGLYIQQLPSTSINLSDIHLYTFARICGYYITCFKG